MTEYFIRTALLASAVAFFCLLGEVSIRIYYWSTDGIPITEWHRFLAGNFGATTLDVELGWKATENYRAWRKERSKKGISYSVELSQNEYGFRMFGDISSSRPKVMVIGDSFTHAREVSD